jgi:N-carbamoyl-L-amino-acid hydrolase
MDTRIRDVEPERLAQDLASLAELRADAPGWTRQVFTDPDRAGRERVAALMREIGLETHIDAAGNVIGRRRGSGAQRGSLVTGSHTDTVLGGGRFDGMVGVLGAIEVARLLSESGIELQRDLVIVDFVGEEPNEFGLSCVGSRALAGTLTPQHLGFVDDGGRTLAQAIRGGGGDPDAALRLSWSPKDVHSYFELHIEQGPYLERLGRSIGVVTGIVGIQRFRTHIRGRLDHAGTTAMDDRHDAGLAAAEAMLAVEGLALDGAVATTGRIELEPGATNVVPGSALLNSECRSIDPGWFPSFMAGLNERFVSIAERRGVEVDVTWLTLEPPTPMDAWSMSTVLAAARLVGHEVVELASYAGHDAVQMANLGPSAMIFVPSRGGRSHCPEEWTDLKDLAAGVATLATSLVLADRT